MWPLAQLLPHAGNMILLDRIEHHDEESIVAYARVREDAPFTQPDGSYPAYVGIEIMAQSIAAYAGLRAKQAGEPVKLGFLLGTRRYECNVERFPAGSELRICARRSLEDESGMGVFECELDAHEIRVTARLNVYRPENVDGFIRETMP